MKFSTIITIPFLILFIFSFVPVTSGQTELITNGGFESGSTGWVLSGDFYADSRFSNPHSGVGYAYLSNQDGTSGNNLFGNLYQAITIPSGSTSATLTFWVSITTQETAAFPYDVLNTTIQDSIGEYLTTVVVLSNVHAGDYREIPFDLTPFKGQTIRINFLGTTDSSLPTTFRIDDVSVVSVQQTSSTTSSTTSTTSYTTTSTTTIPTTTSSTTTVPTTSTTTYQSSSTTTISNTFRWPVDNVKVNQVYACRMCIEGGDRYDSGINIHTGVDVKPVDAEVFDYTKPVKASADGWVERVRQAKLI